MFGMTVLSNVFKIDYGYSLSPPTLRALAMADTIKTLEKENQQLQKLLCTTQGEVNSLI